MPLHLFDEAIALAPAGEGRFTGTSHPAWANMVGPFGGVSAAVLLNAVLQHPALLGAPVSLTVNFCAPLANGTYEVLARPARTNRSTQHWTIELQQTGTDGQQEAVLTATAVTAARRETWSAHDTPLPKVPAPAEVPRVQLAAPVEWVRRYEMRPVTGALPARWDGQAATDDPQTASLTQLWMRDDPLRPLDFCSLAAMADVFFPRVYLRRSTRVSVGTISMTVYFHADAQQLAQTGTGYLLGQARAQHFRNGYFDQTAQLWNEAGTLLATTHQIVYYKE